MNTRIHNEWRPRSDRQVCQHNLLTITETGDSVVGPDPLYELKCKCGSFSVLQVGAPGHTEHALPDSPHGRLIRARLSRGKGTGYY